MAKFLLQTVSVLLSIEYVSGHGYTTDPPSRQFCAKGDPAYKNTAGCKQIGPAAWEPQSVGNGDVNSDPQGVVRSGICGGGLPRFKGNSHAPASDWKATPISPVGGKFHFKFHCTACHPTSYWEAYQTTKGWTGESELKWSDMKRFCRNDKNGEKPAIDSEHDCPFPEATGNPQDIILVAWNRLPRDSGEMFFACSDVIIGGGGAPTPKPSGPRPTPTPKPSGPRPRCQKWSAWSTRTDADGKQERKCEDGETEATQKRRSKKKPEN